MLNYKITIWIKRIDDILSKNASSNEIGSLRKRLSDMRRSALEHGGEFAIENLVFKTLRNNGYITRLVNYQRSMFDQSFSI